jgi:hypothetical protein
MSTGVWLEIVASQPGPVDGAEINLLGAQEVRASRDGGGGECISSAAAWPRHGEGRQLCIRAQVRAAGYPNLTCVTIHT